MCCGNQARCGDLVRCRVEIPSHAWTSQLSPDHLIHNSQSQLHHAFRAIAECLYLLRSDGYLAFRSMPAAVDAVLAHLDQMFRTAGEPAGL